MISILVRILKLWLERVELELTHEVAHVKMLLHGVGGKL